MKPSVAWNVILLGVALVLGACSPSGPQVGSQTNWLRACDSTDECGGLECICGVCTLPCAELACGELPDSACVASTETGAIAVCGGSAPPSGLCLPRCDEESCPAGTSCLAGVCAPTGTPSARVTLDLSARHQTLVGLGASLAYSDDVIADHAQREALYDLVFRDGGFDALRFRNRYETDDDDLSATAEIIEAATERLGRRPFLFMSSATPPAALKANASRVCEGGDAACTLSTVDDGGFDYAGFANYWRSAFEAYAALGIVPDYFSIQNHPNLVYAEEHRGEACRFLPEEGTASVTIDGEPTDVDYPGYREALEAVTASIADLEEVPRAAVAETTGLVTVGEYVPPLDPTTFQAIAFHMYGVDTTTPNVEALENVRALSEELGIPAFQTEIQAEGFETAVLAHHAFASAGGSLYLQNDLVTTSLDAPPLSLVLLRDEGVQPQDPFHALAHYAKGTDPGWVRIDAEGDSSQLLSSAWLAPEEDALTVILINVGSDELRVEVALPEDVRAAYPQTQVTRTGFDGLERQVSLGELPANGVVHLPTRAIVTLQLTAP